MNKYSESYEKEISLVELLFYCLRKWRWVAGSMIIVAMVAGGYKYLSTIKSNQILQQQQALLEKEGEAVQVEVVKNPSVRYYEQAIASSEQELEKQETYLRDSVVMQLDAYHIQEGTLSFYLDMAEQDETVLNNLIAAYRAYVTDGRLAEQLLDIDDSIPAVDLGYLLSFNKGKEAIEIPLNKETGTLFMDAEQNVFQIKVVALSQETCAAYLEKIEDAIMDYAVELGRVITGHDLRLLAIAQSEKADEEIAEYQDDMLSSYMMLLDKLNTLKKDLETVRINEGETITLGQVFVLVNPVVVATKYGIIGLVLGAFFAVFVLVLLFIILNRLQGVGDFEERFGMKLLGRINIPAKENRWFRFLDRIICQIEEGAYVHISFEEQIKIVSENLKAQIAKENGIKKVIFAGSISVKDVQALGKQITENIQEVAFSDYAKALEELGKSDAVLFIEKKGVSATKAIIQEKRLAEERNVKILGVVVL